jgi:hypothetical protein
VFNSKIKSNMQNNTLELVDLPPRTKSLGHKWIFKRRWKLMELLINKKGNSLSNDPKNNKLWIILTYTHLYKG